jgi:hypothetical protein
MIWRLGVALRRTQRRRSPRTHVRAISPNRPRTPGASARDVRTRRVRGKRKSARKPKPKDDSMLQSSTVDSRWSDPSPNHAANAGEPLTTAPGDFARGQRSQLDRVHVASDFATGMRTTSIPRVTGDFATGTRTTSTPRVTGDFATGMRTIPAAVIIIDHLANAPDELPLAA